MNTKTTSSVLGDFVADGPTLYTWLGSFWQTVYQNPALIRNFQYGQGVLSAQLYLDFLEGIGLLNRTLAPVFHRERWQYAVVRGTQAGTGQAAAIRLDMTPTPVIGPQTGSEFPVNSMFRLGGAAQYANAVTYPLSVQGSTDVITCITDNILRPTVVLVRDRDFTVENNTVFFLRQYDPFTDVRWPKQAVDGDYEITLWCCDTLIDRGWVYNYIGYVLGIKTQSTEFYARFLNAVWDMYNWGSQLAFLRSALGAVFGEPTVMYSQETVEAVLHNADNQQVVTDQRVYTLPLNAVLRDEIVVGGVLQFGDFLSQTLRLYDTLDPMKLGGANEYGAQLLTDVPSLWLGPAFLRTNAVYGLGLDWLLRDIVSAGVDANGNQRLWFDLFGVPADVDAFWNDFWTYCEQHQLAPATCFQDYLYATVSGDGVYGRVKPMEFVLRYFLKYNAMVLVVDRDALNPEVKCSEIPKLLPAFRATIPAHVFLFVVERLHVADTCTLATAREVEVKCWCKPKQEYVVEGLPSQVRMTYTDRSVRKQWVPACKIIGDRTPSCRD